MTDEQHAHLLREITELKKDVQRILILVERLPLDNLATGLAVVSSSTGKTPLHHASQMLADKNASLATLAAFNPSR